MVSPASSLKAGEGVRTWNPWTALLGMEKGISLAPGTAISEDITLGHRGIRCGRTFQSSLPANCLSEE